MFELLIFILFIIFALFLLAIIFSPAIATFLLYKKIKEKNKTYKYLGLVLFIITTGSILYLIYHMFTTGLDMEPQYETVEIKQKIGGSLICESALWYDIHSADYIISYKYKAENDSIYEIGVGTYHSNWPRNEQLVKFDKWIILKTSNGLDSDKLIIGNLETNKWKEYIISPLDIEQTELWEKLKIETELYNWDTQAKVEKIDTTGIVTVTHQYRKANVSTFETHKNGKRKVYYKINRKTGIPKVIKISKESI